MDPVKVKEKRADSCKPEKGRRGLSQGVSLIESLVALLIFMFGVLGWLGLEMAIAEESLQTQARSQASFIANSTADSLKQMGYDEILDSDVPLYYDKDARLTDGPSIFSVSWVAVDLPAAAGSTYKEVTIQVAWMTNKNGLQSVLDLKFEITK